MESNTNLKLNFLKNEMNNYKNQYFEVLQKLKIGIKAREMVYIERYTNFPFLQIISHIDDKLVQLQLSKNDPTEINNIESIEDLLTSQSEFLNLSYLLHYALDCGNTRKKIYVECNNFQEYLSSHLNSPKDRNLLPKLPPSGPDDDLYGPSLLLENGNRQFFLFNTKNLTKKDFVTKRNFPVKYLEATIEDENIADGLKLSQCEYLVHDLLHTFIMGENDKQIKEIVTLENFLIPKSNLFDLEMVKVQNSINNWPEDKTLNEDIKNVEIVESILFIFGHELGLPYTLSTLSAAFQSNSILNNLIEFLSVQNINNDQLKIDINKWNIYFGIELKDLNKQDEAKKHLEHGISLIRDFVYKLNGDFKKENSAKY